MADKKKRRREREKTRELRWAEKSATSKAGQEGQGSEKKS